MLFLCNKQGNLLQGIDKKSLKEREFQFFSEKGRQQIEQNKYFMEKFNEIHITKS